MGISLFVESVHETVNAPTGSERELDCENAVFLCLLSFPSLRSIKYHHDIISFGTRLSVYAWDITVTPSVYALRGFLL